MLVVREGGRRGGEVGVRRRFEKSGGYIEEVDFYYVCVCVVGVYVHLLEQDIWWTNVISCFSCRGITKLKGPLIVLSRKKKVFVQGRDLLPNFFSPPFIFHFSFFFGSLSMLHKEDQSPQSFHSPTTYVVTTITKFYSNEELEFLNKINPTSFSKLLLGNPLRS